MYPPASLGSYLLAIGPRPIRIRRPKPTEAIRANPIQVNLLRRNWRRRSHFGHPVSFQCVTAEQSPNAAKLVRNEPFSRIGRRGVQLRWAIALDYPVAVAKEGANCGFWIGVQGRRPKVPRTEAGMCFRISAEPPGFKDCEHSAGTSDHFTTRRPALCA